MRFLSVFPGTLTVLLSLMAGAMSLSACGLESTNGAEGNKELAMSSSDGVLTFFHSLETGEGSPHQVCVYQAKVPGNASTVAPQQLPSLLQASTLAASPGRYVRVDSLLSEAQKLVDRSIASEIENSGALNTARQIAAEHDKLHKNLSAVLDKSLAFGVNFASVYDRKVRGQDFCRGFMGFGENENCASVFQSHLENNLKTHLRAYLTFLQTQKQNGRLTGAVASFDEVYNRKSVNEFGIRPSGQFESFLTSSESATLTGFRNLNARLQNEILTGYRSAIEPGTFQAPQSTVSDKTEVFSDGSSVRTVLLAKDGGISKNVMAQVEVQRALTAAYRNLQGSFMATEPCPPVSKLAQGLEFEVQKVKTGPAVSTTPNVTTPARAVIPLNIQQLGIIHSVDLPSCKSKLNVIETSLHLQFNIVPQGSERCSKIVVKQFPEWRGDGDSGQSVLVLKSNLERGQGQLKINILSNAALSELVAGNLRDEAVSEAKMMDVVSVRFVVPAP